MTNYQPKTRVEQLALDCIKCEAAMHHGHIEAEDRYEELVAELGEEITIMAHEDGSISDGSHDFDRAVEIELTAMHEKTNQHYRD